MDLADGLFLSSTPQRGSVPHHLYESPVGPDASQGDFLPLRSPLDSPLTFRYGHSAVDLTPSLPCLATNPSTPASSSLDTTCSSSFSFSSITDTPDRLVPGRGEIEKSVGVATFDISGKLCNHQLSEIDANNESYKLNLACSVFDSSVEGVAGRVLPLGDQGSNRMMGADRNLRMVYSRNKRRNFKSKAVRYIPQTPERILDAPDLIDDYYLNLLDWSCQNILAVALNQTVYLWNADTGEIQQLTQTVEDDNIVTSVAFSQDGATLAVGTNNTEVELWDVCMSERTSIIKGHLARVGSLSWNGRQLASGSRDSDILIHDVRSPTTPYAMLTDHQQEVCGLKWSFDGTQLASGGNDNLLHIWDHGRLGSGARLRLTAHSAAVKAISWSPHQSNLLVSGGGTADRSLRFWNTANGECINTIDTKSQVCSVIWATHMNELLTSHSFPENQLSLWKYPSMKRMASLTGHASRVLHLALSPDGQTVVSAAGDETIRFWKCFVVEKTKRRQHLQAVTSPFGPLTLR
eukprot:Sspe_Gene.3829::Locus_1276_Transcript_1_1_Confidence_1.000_Length_1667::g.3829::m.3829/K03363/CDC20; cell division cycle 20, cofactor of APC complex